MCHIYGPLNTVHFSDPDRVVVYPVCVCVCVCVVFVSLYVTLRIGYQAQIVLRYCTYYAVRVNSSKVMHWSGVCMFVCLFRLIRPPAANATRR